MRSIHVLHGFMQSQKTWKEDHEQTLPVFTPVSIAWDNRQ